MASPLEGQIAKAIYAGFKGKLKNGTLRREVKGSGVNSLGDAISSSVLDYAFEGIREMYSATFRAATGIPDEDVSVLILLRSVTVQPAKDDYVLIEGLWHQVRKVEDIDPAGATIKLQCTVTTEVPS